MSEIAIEILVLIICIPLLAWIVIKVGDKL